MKIDLHIHSNHSFDGKSSVESLLDNAKEAGLDAIAITDHDNMSACGVAKKVANNIVIIPGMEITSEGGTHIIGLFLKEEIVSRNITEIIDEIHEQGGLVLLPHPYRAGTGLVYNRDKMNLFNGEDMVQILSGVDLIEAVNARCSQDAMVNTDRYLALHPDIPQTASSDAHVDYEVGSAYVDLEKVKSNSLDDIREALLYSPRTMRFEVYCDEKERETRTVRLGGKKKSLMLRTRKLVPPYIRKSIQTIYEKSAGKLMHPRRDKIKEER